MINRCVRALNREVGLSPTRSRRCNEEFTLREPLEKIREGEVNDDSEPEELPIDQLSP